MCMSVGREQRADGSSEARQCGCGQNVAAVRCLLQPTQSGTVSVVLLSLYILGFVTPYSYYYLGFIISYLYKYWVLLLIISINIGFYS